MFKIFIIEDDLNLANLIKKHLKKYDYQVETVTNFQEIEKEVKEVQPDLILLDINLPYYDGFYLCRVIRKTSQIPILIISARNEEIEQVMGIELGADDYITKPFSIDILLAKIMAILRRTSGEYINQDNEIIIKGLKLNTENFNIKYLDEDLDLSQNEFKLVKKLMEESNTVISRQDLLETLWDDSSFVDDNTLTVNVSRVKEKLAKIGLSEVIETKRGAGYILNTGRLERNCNE